MPRKKPQNGNRPVTQADPALVAGEMSLRFDGVNAELKEIRGDIKELRGDIKEIRGDIQDIRGDIHEMKADIANLYQGQAAILKVVTSIEAQLQELKTLPARVARLERSRQ